MKHFKNFFLIPLKDPSFWTFIISMGIVFMFGYFIGFADGFSEAFK